MEKYYEVVFGKKSEQTNPKFNGKWDTYSICITAKHFPTPEEAEKICKVEMKRNGYDMVCSVTEVSEPRCKVLEGAGFALRFALYGEATRSGQTLCDTCGYDFKECPKSMTARADISGYRRIRIDQKLPFQRAWCKTCAKESAKPISYVNFNGGPGVVVECEHCHGRYVMYESMYIERYVGRHTQYGYIPPSHGKTNAIPKNVKMKMDAALNARLKETHRHLSSLFGMSEEELTANKKQWADERAKLHKEIEQQNEERRNTWKQEEAVDKAKSKSQLIKDGIIKYNKAAKCFVDTRTGEVVTL